jgi:hypothetical protein
MASGRLLLPMEAAMALPCAAQGWRAATAIAPSLLRGAGNGRFVLEDVRAGSIIAVKPLQAMSSVQTLRSIAADTALSFSSIGDLEKYVDLGAADGGFTPEQSRATVEHYLWSLDGERGILNWATWSVNHGGADGTNLTMFHDKLSHGDEVIVSEVTKDLASDTELLMDYTTFDMPAFYLEYCDKHGFDDERSAVLTAIGEATS